MPYREWARGEDGDKQALAVGGYFDHHESTVDTWLFSSLPAEQREAYEPFRMPRFRRTLAGWLNVVSAAGSTIEAAGEPHADEDLLRQRPDW